MSAEAKQGTDVGLALDTPLNVTSLCDLKALPQKAEKKSVQRGETPGCGVLVCGIPPTTRTRSEAACPERVIPKAQGHLVAGRELWARSCPALSSPLPLVSQTLGEGNSRGTEGR